MQAPEILYRDSWDNFWRDVATTTGEVFWDSDPTQAIERELPLFQQRIDASLPLIDLGCGTGRQTRALGEHFSRVLGLDVAEEAIVGARQLHGRDHVDFRVFDVLEPAAASRLHAEIGDANVYVRAVLHQLRAAHRRPAVETLTTLLGARGQAFVVELSPLAEALFASLGRELGGPPPKLARVFQHGIVPAALAAGEIPGLFAECGFHVALAAQSSIVTTQPLPNGQMIEVPCDAWLFARS